MGYYYYTIIMEPKPPITKKLSNFRVTMIHDFHLESYYKNNGGGTNLYEEKPLNVNSMGIDKNTFLGIPSVGSSFKSLTKGYKFDFKIDSEGFNDSDSSIRIGVKYYTVLNGIPEQKSPERQVFWRDSNGKIIKIGEEGHSKYKEIILTPTNREITSESDGIWTGSFLIPGTAFATPMGTSLNEASNLFKTYTYLKEDIIVGFSIKGYVGEDQIFDYNESNWPLERTNSIAPYGIGDVIRYNWNSNCLWDIKKRIIF